MLSFLLPWHPLAKTHAKSQDLVVRVNKLLRTRDKISRSLSVTDSFKRLASRERDLHMSVRTEVGWWATCGATSRHGAWQIQARFGCFQATLRELDQKLASAGGQRTRKLVAEVHRTAEALRLAIVRLGKAVDSGSVAVVENHGRYLEGFIRVREAMSSLDKIAAEELAGPEVDAWSRWPGLDHENPRQVLRIAKLILLSKVPDQVFGLSVQSNAPGRSLKPMTRLDRFPTEEDLRALGSRMGGPVKIYVTASKPKWRKVWTFDPDNVVWWE